MHTLQQMVRDQMTFEQMRNGARGGGGLGMDMGVDSVEIREDDLLMRMRELDIHEISMFLDSREFRNNGFKYDKERRMILRNV